MHSMTGFARHTESNSNITVTWEIKTLNNRFLEVYIKLPDLYRRLDLSLRDLVKQKLKRGKVEIYVTINNNDNNGLNLDTQKLDSMFKVISEVEQFCNSKGLKLAPINFFDLINSKNDLNQEDESDAVFKSNSQLIYSSLGRALDILIFERYKEGSRLKVALLDLVNQIESSTREVNDLFSINKLDAREKLLAKIQEYNLDNVSLDNNRLEQEIVFIIQKLDIKEEIDRLNSHCIELRNTLAEDISLGRKLDFMIQELNREVNTICSKSINKDLLKAGVNMKVIIEQMREQIQNIE